MVKNAFERAHFSERAPRSAPWILGLSLALGVVGSLFGCRAKPRQHARAAASAASAARVPRLPPLAASSWLVELEVDGFGKAALAVPLGATEPRSVLIALHGAADRPEWACGAWRGVAGPTPFVLCPRGIERADFSGPDVRYTFGAADAVAAELRASLAALKRRFGAHVAPGAEVFVGFEVGADRVAEIARQEPTFFTRLVLVDPAPDTWPSSAAALFGRQGGERVLFAAHSARRVPADFTAALTRRGGADARAVALSSAAPGLESTTVSELARLWPWLTAPFTHRSPPEDLVGNPLTARRPDSPRPP